MLIKIHHCAIDGIAGIELMNALHDLDPGGRDPVVDTWQAGARRRTARAAGDDRRQRGAVAVARRPLPDPFGADAAAPVDHAARRLGRHGRRSKRPPTTRLNQRVTTNRVGDAIVIDLDDAKRVRAAVAGATVNDVLLTVVGGGLRRVPRRAPATCRTSR